MTATGQRRVHQILATLGYGDAIGHEVLGIRRALRGAGFASEIVVEAADRAVALGLRFARIEMPNADPALIGVLAGIARRELAADAA